MLGRDDVDNVVNACDAGREGELIFAWLYEKAGAKKPVQRLWLSSMTTGAIKQAFGALRPGEEFHKLEEAARSRSEADWIVGMNATRAATIRLRSSFDGAVSLGRVQTPTLAIVARREVEIREFKPEKYWLVDATFEPQEGEKGRALSGPLPRGREAAHRQSAEEAEAIVAAVRGQAGQITKLETTTKKERAPLLYDLTSLQREANNRYGFSARRTLAAAQRLYEEHKALTYPRTNSRFLSTDMIERDQADGRGRGQEPRLRQAGRLRDGARRPAARPRDQRRQGHRPPRDHPDALRAPRGQDERRRQEDLRHGRPALPRRLPSRRGVGEHAPRDDRRRARLPHPRPRAARAGLALRLRRGRRRAARRARPTTTRSTRRCPSSPPTSASTRARSPPRRRRPSRRGATPTRRCWARWRRPARTSTTRSCASDEGLRDRHAGHARRDHRAPDRRRLHRARRAARWCAPRRASTSSACSTGTR